MILQISSARVITCRILPSRMVFRLVFSSLPSVGLTRSFATKAPSRPLLGRYTNRVPVDLARVQSGVHVKLRDYEAQKELKRFSYDLKLQSGKVLPADGPNFIGASYASDLVHMYEHPMI